MTFEWPSTIDEGSLPAGAVVRTFATRRVDVPDVWRFTTSATPAPGDVVVARVMEVGHCSVIELPTGRKQTLYTGVNLLLAYGNRYAPDQVEAFVATDLGACHLAASGGIAATVVGSHAQVGRPTVVQPLGLAIGADGRVLNLASYALAGRTDLWRDNRSTVIAVLGSSMNAGKTECAVRIIRRYVREGRSVAAAKLTGTAAGNDLWRMRDAGAEPVLDFTDAGYATTAGASPGGIEAACETLIGTAAHGNPEVIVVEVSDGLLQPETAALIGSPLFSSVIDGVVFAASDVLGAVAGVEAIRYLGLGLLGVSGTMSQSPLARRKVEIRTCVPTYSADELADPDIVLLWPRAKSGHRQRALGHNRRWCEPEVDG